MEKFMYPSKTMRITQGYMTGTHVSSYAIDDGCDNTGKSSLNAPYSGTVKQIYSQYENEVFFESDTPILFADGTKDFAVTMFLHQDSPMAYGMAIGKHYNQGEPIYIEGGRYKGKNGSLANHVHMEFAQGKYVGNGWYKNASGYYSLRNAKKPQDCCFIDDSYKILNNNGYGFKNVKEVETKRYGTPVERNEYVNQIKINADNVRARTSPNGDIIGYMNPGLYNSLEFTTVEGYDWHKVEEGLYCAMGEWAEWFPKKKKPVEPPKQDETTTKIDELNNTINSLKKELSEKENIINNLTSGSAELTNKIIDQDKIIKELEEKLSNPPKLIFESPKLDFYAIKLDQNEKLYLEK